MAATGEVLGRAKAEEERGWDGGTEGAGAVGKGGLLSWGGTEQFVASCCDFEVVGMVERVEETWDGSLSSTSVIPLKNPCDFDNGLQFHWEEGVCSALPCDLNSMEDLASLLCATIPLLLGGQN